jgi:hypothetical protein
MMAIACIALKRNAFIPRRNLPLLDYLAFDLIEQRFFSMENIHS